jgi:hypothetical protein
LTRACALNSEANLQRINAERELTNVLPIIEIPEMTKLYNYLATLRTKLFSPTNMSLGQLAAFCLDHNETPLPSLPDEPFVVNYNIFFPDDEPEDLLLFHPIYPLPLVHRLLQPLRQSLRKGEEGPG